MTKATFKLARQAGAWGYYAEIFLQQEATSGPKCLLVEFNDQVPSGWRVAVHFGLHYAYDLLVRAGHSSGLEVRVLAVAGHEVDTTAIVLAYTSAHALWKALDFVPDRMPMLDAESGRVCFPK